MFGGLGVDILFIVGMCIASGKWDGVCIIKLFIGTYAVYLVPGNRLARQIPRMDGRKEAFAFPGEHWQTHPFFNFAGSSGISGHLGHSPDPTHHGMAPDSDCGV